ncbi:MAG: acyltransferase family protein [Anaerolineales bacterium]|nr:acyltransferase family protein [Anaerolineales bacterium]MCB9144356.1 acyltransferase family protein [Anaerolineales bacterium]
MLDTISSRKTNFIPWVDVIRFLAAFLVVLAHAVDLVNIPWVWGAFYYTLSRIAVPIFFMVSGYLILSHQEDFWTFFYKRFLKVFIPFLVWSIIFDLFRENPFQEHGFTLQSVAGVIIRILRGPRYDHLWFFYSLFGLYLFTPILRIFIKNAKLTEVLYFVALWLLVKPVMLLMGEYFLIRQGFDLGFVDGYVGYFLIGYLLGQSEITRRMLVWSWLFFLIGFVFSFSVFYFDIPPVDNELILRDYLSLNIVIMSLGSFVVLRSALQTASKSLIYVAHISAPHIFGIYLIHPLILYWLTRNRWVLGFDSYQWNALFMTPLLALITFGSGWLIVYLMHRVPILRALF